MSSILPACPPARTHACTTPLIATCIAVWVLACLLAAPSCSPPYYTVNVSETYTATASCPGGLIINNIINPLYGIALRSCNASSSYRFVTQPRGAVLTDAPGTVLGEQGPGHL